MTTIATDGVTIAADGLSTAQYGLIVKHRTKKMICEPCAIYAAAGSDALTQVLVDWHKNGADPLGAPVYKHDAGWTLLVIRKAPLGYHGLVQVQAYSSEAPYPYDVELPCAIGSGAELAIGAMEHGASPEQAIRIAMKRSAFTGGELEVINIADALKIRPYAVAAE